MVFFSTAAQVAVRMETMRKAEAGLVALARRFGEQNGSSNSLSSSSYTMELFDTKIPAAVLPFRKSSTSSWLDINPWGADDDTNSKEELTMHAICVRKNKNEDEDRNRFFSLTKPQETHAPLVIVHGYMNGALYFYRNLLGLANHFGTVFSVDLLGWGLSSRPSLENLRDDSVETAEAFFVESLEAWRSKNGIDKMTLAGHSMGGYLSVAYCEKYPQRVDRLLLLSPVGIPEESDRDQTRRARFLTSPLRKMAYGFFTNLWEQGYTPGSVLRSLPERQGRNLVEGYVRNRIPAIQDSEEQATLSEYMYTSSILPGSGEYGLNRLLKPGAMAKKPCLYRIPKLQVKQVSFLYGTMDWMDVRGGLDVQKICREEQLQLQLEANTRQQQTKSNNSDSTTTAVSIVPNVDVYRVPNAGHLLMLENSSAFNAAVIVAAGGNPNSIQDPSDLPMVATAAASSTTPSRDENGDSGKRNGNDRNVRATA